MMIQALASLVLIVSTSLAAQAQVDVPVDDLLAIPTPAPTATPAPSPTLKDRAGKAVSRVGAEINNSLEYRALSPVTLMLAWAPIDLILPSKFGASVAWNRTPEASHELEYLSAKMSVPFFVDDLGGFTDRRVSLLKRSFNARNSFNFHYGLSYFDTEIHVGNDYLAQANANAAEVDLLRIKSLGFIWGFGNRWNFAKGLTAGVDWFSWSQPLLVIHRDNALVDSMNEGSAKDRVETTMKLVEYLPRLTVLKVALGYSF